MRKERTTLLAGIAALALVAGTSLASAQQTGNEQHGAKQPNAASQMSKPNAASPMNKGGGTMGENAGAQNGGPGKMNQNAAEGQSAGGKMNKMNQSAAEGKSTSAKMGMGQNAQEQNRSKTTQRSAQFSQHGQRTTAGREGVKNGMTAQERARFGNERNGRTAQRNDRNGQNMAAQERNGLKGLQGNARVNVQINDQQRTRIRETVIDARGAPRIDHVGFNVAVGTVVPRTGVRMVPVTPALVSIDPSWRGLRYFVYEQELVLIDPATMTIVAVINV